VFQLARKQRIGAPLSQPPRWALRCTVDPPNMFIGYSLWAAPGDAPGPSLQIILAMTRHVNSRYLSFTLLNPATLSSLHSTATIEDNRSSPYNPLPR